MTRLSMTMGAFADFAISTAAKSAKAPIDRKSTRLNSSHLGISYALFCLKKKKDRGPVVPATPQMQLHGRQFPPNFPSENSLGAWLALALTLASGTRSKRESGETGPAPQT